MKHLKYLKYVIIHKWFVLVAGLKIGAPLFRLIIHDWSKFLPSEWIPYAHYFYGEFWPKEDLARCQMVCGTYPYKYDKNYWEFKFDVAWNHHQKRNKHHWQYWLLQEDNGKLNPLQIPDKYIKEMVADWMGAGRAITGEWEVKEWYGKNKDKMIMHGNSRAKVEKILENIK